MSRPGMSNLIVRTRRLVNDSNANTWTDDEIEDVLDTHKLRIHREAMEKERTLTSGTAYEYKIYHSRHGDFEEGGTAYFHVQDSAGSARATGDYTADYIRGMVTMGADQAGTELYLTGWSYDLHGAAADLWRWQAGNVAGYYDAQQGDHKLNRSQWFKHCLEMAELNAMQARPTVVRPWREGVFEDE